MDTEAIYKALANPIRRDISQSTMSNHLSVLQQAGLIQVTKYGQWSYFSRNEALIQEFLQHLQHAL